VRKFFHVMDMRRNAFKMTLRLRRVLSRNGNEKGAVRMNGAWSIGGISVPAGLRHTNMGLQ
jgi:hypothetical protein